MVETEGIPHRSAFAHFNTGITELEYFGHGRYLVMSTNTTPHIPPQRYTELRSGGTLRDGWSFLVPPLLQPEVDVIFSDDDLQDHIREQATALKALYLSSGDTHTSKTSVVVEPSSSLQVEEEVEPKNETLFVVKRGLQVVGVATYSESTGQLRDVAIRPTAATSTSSFKDDNTTSEASIAETLMEAVKKHARKMGRSNSLVVHARTPQSMSLFESLGFTELERGSGTGDDMDGSRGTENNTQAMRALL
jgi:N-acetylglutamate synthase-like GNAT family acetyltransferase